MTERDLTRREDRLIGLCLAATAIIVVFIFILSTAYRGSGDLVR